MRKKIAVLLLAASLVLNVVGCGKEESSAGTGGGDAVDLSGDGGSAGRNQVQEDFVIVQLPTISKDAFGNGFYDAYALIPPARESFDYDEDGLLTDAKFLWGSESVETRLMLRYEKRGDMVTACAISADLYAWFLDRYSGAGARDSIAEEYSEELAAKMPYRIKFDEPVEPDPDVVAEAILGKVDEEIERLDNLLLPSMDSSFYKAFNDMYRAYLSGALQTDGTRTNEPEISWDEDGLLTGGRKGFTTESGEASESWIAVEYQKEDGLVTACKVSADLYSFFVYEYGLNEETAKEWNDELTGKMPLELMFDEPADSGAVAEWTYQMLEECAGSEADYGLLEAFNYFYNMYSYMYSEKLYLDATGNTAGIGYEVVVGGIATREFKGRVNVSDLSDSYFFGYGGGVPMGELKITNDPGWSIGMSVSHEEVICQIETEQDLNGNITLVHRYNDYASYDDVFTYDSAGRMTRRDHYEYPKGQNREAVGALWYDEYSYDGEGRLTGAREQSTQDNGVNTEIRYYYDDMGRMTGQEAEDHFFGEESMTMQQMYDSVVQSYDYDDSGKVDTVTVTVNWSQTSLQPNPTEPTTVAYLPE